MGEVDVSVLSKRVRDLRDSLLHATPRLSCERARFLVEAYRETEGEAPVTRRARVFQKVLNGMTIFIDENPIVGTLTKYRAGVQPYPESACRWMRTEAQSPTSSDRDQMSEEDQKSLEDAVDYWKDKCVVSKADEAWTQRHPGRRRSDYTVATVTWMPANPAMINVAEIVVDYGKVLSSGLTAVIEEAEAEIRNLPFVSLDALRKKAFLRAVVASCSAVIAFAQRYAALAEKMAAGESDPTRKDELLRISETCRWVPAKPARTFYEAIQSFWFIHLATLIEGCSAGHSPGRFALYMHPFYKADKESGRISQEEALELIELLFIKLSEINLYQPGMVFSSFFAQMASQGQVVALGGLTADGEDATNEVDFLVLEAQRRVRTLQPNIAVLYHNRMPEEFLRKCAELLATGMGMPSFINNDVNIQRALREGASLEEARNHCIIGGLLPAMSHAHSPLGKSGSFSMPKSLEFALNEGTDPLTSKPLGVSTGSAAEFKSFEELFDATKKQFEYQFQLFYDYEFGSHAYVSEALPVPFTSALVDDCIKRGLDVNGGGARYETDGVVAVGVIDLADSLSAIKKLVFDDKRVTMPEMLAALRADFEGYEELRRMCLAAPKFGNGDEPADQMVRDWYRIFEEEHRKRKDHLGNDLRPVALSTTNHFPLGARVGALPSGRKSGQPLANGTLSPSPGMDKSGPDALLRSAARALDTVRYAGGLFNVRLHPRTLEGPAGFRKLISLIDNYLHMGGHHIQFNVVSTETLRDAQLRPEEYRELIVLPGNSAFFIHLDPVVQNELISRTEISL